MGPLSKLQFQMDFIQQYFNFCCLSQQFLLKQTWLMQQGRSRDWWYEHGLAMGMLPITEVRQCLQVQIYRKGKGLSSPQHFVAALGTHSTALWILIDILVTGDRCRSLKGICDTTQQLANGSLVLLSVWWCKKDHAPVCDQVCKEWSSSSVPCLSQSHRRHWPCCSLTWQSLWRERLQHWTG